MGEAAGDGVLSWQDGGHDAPREIEPPKAAGAPGEPARKISGPRGGDWVVFEHELRPAQEAALELPERAQRELPASRTVQKRRHLIVKLYVIWAQSRNALGVELVGKKVD